MFFYNSIKETIQTKYKSLLVILALSILTIYLLTKDTVHNQMSSLEVLFKLLSVHHLSMIFIPLIIIFAVYTMSGFFNIYVIHRMNNTLKLVSIYYLKVIIFTMIIGGVIIFQSSLTAYVISSGTEKINFFRFVPFQMFSIIFIGVVAAFLQLLLPNILVIIILICTITVDALLLNGYLFIHTFFQNPANGIGIIALRVGIFFFIYALSIFIIEKKNYISSEEEKEVH
ncbi:hypothetical protein ACTFRN_09415 [Bacillus cereus group sp. MYBK245-2]|uniref:Uncharacterized protein n=3 Tax=Bacteria TaxID=2 RepID=A0A1Y5ZD70_9BACI|nr:MULTISPECIES: hypothetical protein [Bacillus cereus group]ONG85823.1 hypothetical protein BKK40_27780 [Bacillus cereus]MCZ7519723.1 hypothetical protein [Bacillus pacificus]MDA1576296.1 hypothetical protein [Bacillus cereus group sp. TH242-3LC]MDA1828930.1 hypothetical protein [Bacillus cereus group sp. BY25LC]MDA1895082.1 hypothetical protein [Bacillus cereus group sp. BcHK28]